MRNKDKHGKEARENKENWNAQKGAKKEPKRLNVESKLGTLLKVFCTDYVFFAKMLIVCAFWGRLFLALLFLGPLAMFWARFGGQSFQNHCNYCCFRQRQLFGKTVCYGFWLSFCFLLAQLLNTFPHFPGSGLILGPFWHLFVRASFPGPFPEPWGSRAAVPVVLGRGCNRLCCGLARRLPVVSETLVVQPFGLARRIEQASLGTAEPGFWTNSGPWTASCLPVFFVVVSFDTNFVFPRTNYQK